MTALTVEDARKLLFAEVPPPEPADVPLPRALGLVLAEDVASDLDMPPWDKAMMDGYAVISSDALELEVTGAVHAGETGGSVRPGTAIKIMTGAPVPAGADAVMQVEKTETRGSRVVLKERASSGLNIAPRGQDLRKGDVVLRAGKRLGAADLGVLATVGRAQARVWRRPTVALVVTGDEIVEPGEPLRPGTIRNSNAYSLAAQLADFEPRYLGIARDDRDDLRAKIREGLKADVLILAGGVSAGDKDFVIPCLEAEGVTHRMHQVLIRPGRPIFFGTLGRKRIFGLPGNPVSTFVTFEVFVRPFLGRMMGGDLERPRVRAKLKAALPKKAERAQYLPAFVADGEVETLEWQGSADLVTVSRANGFVIVPIRTAYEKGDVVDVLML